MTLSRWLPPLLLYVVALLLLAHAARSLGLTALEPTSLSLAEDFARRLSSSESSITRIPGAFSLLSIGLPALSSTLFGSSLGGFRTSTVVLSAIIPIVVYFISIQFSGWRTATAAALFSLLVPRALLEGATLGGDGPLTALLWGGFLAHLRSQNKPSLAILAGTLFAAALSISPSVLLTIPVLLLHQAWVDPERSLLRRGIIVVPLSTIVFFFLAPFAVWLLTPSLWSLSGAALQEWLISAASPEILPGLWAGDEVTPDVIPRFSTACGLLTALPSLSLILAGIGLWKFRDDSMKQRPELALAILVLLVWGAWPLLCPPGLGRFPGHFALLVPAAALLAARGVESLPLPRQCWELPLPMLLFVMPLLSSTVGVYTLSSQFSWITGGLWRPAIWGPEPLYDESTIGGLLKKIDSDGKDPISIYSVEIPYKSWETLHRLGRLQRTVIVARRLDQAELAVLPAGRLAAGFHRVKAVRWDGRDLLVLWKRNP